MTREHPSLWLVRSRRAALGAVLAVTLGYGGLSYAGASTQRTIGNVFVPIVPCRLFDTRPAPATIGTRARPRVPDEEFVSQVTGAKGGCVPATSTAVVLNVIAVGPVGDGFRTVWPADAPRPNTSNLNFSDGQTPVANAVTVKLGGGGIRFSSSASRVDPRWDGLLQRAHPTDQCDHLFAGCWCLPSECRLSYRSQWRTHLQHLSPTSRPTGTATCTTVLNPVGTANLSPACN